MISKPAIMRAFKISLPIGLAYIPLGMVFGLLVENQGYYWLLAPFMSLTIFGGAVQFLALSMLEQGNTILSIIAACLFVAIRNSFYLPAFFERFKGFRVWVKAYLGFAMVDTTYALLLSPKPVSDEEDETYCFSLALFVHAFWVAGTFLGAAVGKILPHMPGLEFSLTILFAILAIEQFLKVKKAWPFMFAFMFWLPLHIFLPKYALVGGIFMTAFIIWLHFKREETKLSAKGVI